MEFPLSYINNEMVSMSLIEQYCNWGGMFYNGTDEDSNHDVSKLILIIIIILELTALYKDASFISARSNS